jgi:hypothetical protein
VVANCDHLNRLKFSPVLPFVFTEHGAIMAAQAQLRNGVVESSAEVVMATEPTELTGKVVDGVIVLDEPGVLEEGTTVRVTPEDPDVRPMKARSRLGERLLKFAGTLEGLPPDMSKNLDHYLYGVPKRDDD